MDLEALQKLVRSLPPEERAGAYLEAMRTERISPLEIHTSSDTRQNSVEIGQSAKGVWSVKSVKIYFDHDEDPEEIAIRLMKAVELALKAIRSQGPRSIS